MAEPFVIARTADGTDLTFIPAWATATGSSPAPPAPGRPSACRCWPTISRSFGVPVFLADVKGDLSGVAAAGSASPKLKERLAATGIAEPAWSANPVVFWDVFGKRGFPVRATVSDVGPLLLGRLFNLNATQQGVLTLVFKVADDDGLLLLDLKDLRAMLQYVGDNARQFTTDYGNVSAASIGAIQRALLEIEQQGGATVLRRADARHRRSAPDRRAGPRRRQRARGRRAGAAAEAVRDVPAVDAVGAVRAAAGSRRSGEADARLLLRRGAPAVQRRAGRAGREDRTGRAADSFEGRRRLLRHAEPLRHPRHRARPARQPRPARAARLHAARSEGGEDRGRRRCGRTRSSTSSTRSPNWPSAKRWSRCSTRRARPTVTERAWMVPPVVADRPDHGRRARPRFASTGRRSTGTTSRRSIASRRTRS